MPLRSLWSCPRRHEPAGALALRLPGTQHRPSPAPRVLLGPPALTTLPSIPARPHSRGSVQPVLPDPRFISRAVALEQQELACPQWLLDFLFLVLTWFSEVEGAFPADGVGLTKTPAPCPHSGSVAALGTSRHFPWASPRTSPCLAPGVSARPGARSC